MRIIARNRLLDFWQRHPGTRAPLLHWLSVARDAGWISSDDAQQAFSKAKTLGGDRVRYDIARGDQRLIVAYDFRGLIAFGKLVGTPAECDRIDALATLIEAYEDRRWPVEELDPIEAVMAHNGHSRADLAKLIGQSRATKILKRRRALTLSMIRKISSEWRVPERVLVREYRVG